MTTIEQIAGKFLGNNTRYETPNKHDASLLVKIPRHFNRDAGNIDSTLFVGFEVWHCYEFSYIKLNGMPTTGVLKISYPATSPYIVESKSLKLYTNSFDLEKFNNKSQVENIIKTDLSNILETDVQVTLHTTNSFNHLKHIFNNKFDSIDNEDIKIESYNEDINLLLENPVNYNYPNTTITFHTANLRSNCEITNQKDTGNCYIFMEGQRLPHIHSLTRYIISMREAQHFHENVTEIIYNSIMLNFRPNKLFVCNLYNRRGGIDIHSIRASSNTLISEIMNEYSNTEILHEKTMQQ